MYNLRESSFEALSEVERRRLGELVTLLTARLRTAEDRATEAEVQLREARQRCARAEIAAERAAIDLRDSGKLSGGLGGSRTHSGFRRALEEDVGRMRCLLVLLSAIS